MALDCTRLLFSADTGSRRSALLWLQAVRRTPACTCLGGLLVRWLCCFIQDSARGYTSGPPSRLGKSESSLIVDLRVFLERKCH